VVNSSLVLLVRAAVIAQQAVVGDADASGARPTGLASPVFIGPQYAAVRLGDR
jgi:hypothetical protein